MSASHLSRRTFLQGSTAAVAAASLPLASSQTFAAPGSAKPPAAESVVKVLFESMTDKQKKEVCFDWDYR